MDGWMDEKEWKIRIGNNTDRRHVRHTSAERGEQDIIRTDISSLARNRWWDRATHRQDLPANTGLTENSVSSYMHRHTQTQTLTCKSWWGSVGDLWGCIAVTVAPPAPHFFPLPCSVSSPFQCFTNPHLLPLTLSIHPPVFFIVSLWNVMVMHLNSNKPWCPTDTLHFHSIQLWIPVPGTNIYVRLVNYSLQVVERQYN